jgi:phospholipid-binding lipoprotein MlaA
MSNRVLRCAASFAVLALLQSSICFAAETKAAEVTADDSSDVTIADPYEKYNRHTFAFNDALDRNLLQPVARFYNKIMPKPLNKGIHNFFLNLNTVSTIADDFLQFNFYQMTNDLWRFTINTTIGIGGLFDVATRMNLPFYENDFGMTLATWGYRKSNYLILPFYGSYTVRDAMSLPVDFYALSAYQYIEPPSLGYGIYAIGVIDWRAQTLKYNALMDAAALDKYIFVRNAYMQRRAFQLEQNRHLGLWEREKIEPVNAGNEEKKGAPGSAANIDESSNIGAPAVSGGVTTKT